MTSLILASQSPRRSQLLKELGYKFQILTVEVSEILDENLNLDEGIQNIARQKARALVESGKLKKLHDYVVLSGDTVVVLEGRILGKPQNEAQAREYLRLLSGATHSVKTGVCFYSSLSGQELTTIETSEVEFHTLTDQQIYEYVETGDPMDKAGAYGIQSLDRNFIKEIRGSRENVMGLPVQLVSQIIEKSGWKFER